MALVLKRKEEQRVFIGDTPVAVTNIRSPMNYTVAVQTEFMTNEFDVSDKQGVELMPGIFLSAGYNTDREAIKMVFRAPANVAIYREEIYLERKQGTKHKA